MVVGYEENFVSRLGIQAATVDGDGWSSFGDDGVDVCWRSWCVNESESGLDDRGLSWWEGYAVRIGVEDVSRRMAFGVSWDSGS